MKYFSIVILLFSFTLSPGLSAESLSRDSFAYGYSLEVDGDGAIYSLYLNEQIYQGLVREDRGDLRIFNSLGAVVPHDIRRAEQMTKKTVAPVSLPIFPLYANSRDDSIGAVSKSIRITTNDQGTIIDLNYGKVDVKDRVRTAYIIDASGLKDTPRHMLLDWQSENDQFIMKISVEGSNDLNSWRTIIPSATISNMKWDKHTLVQREIDLPGQIPKYLRLRWSGKDDLDLKEVNIHFSERYQSQQRQWSKFKPARYDKQKAQFYFETKTVIPVDRLKLVPQAKNTLLNVSIESASTAAGPWYSRYHGLIYDLQFDQTRLVSPDIHQRVTSHRFWRVTVLNGGGYNDSLSLHLGWIPEQLLFVATGEAPFTLTYGSARVGPVAAPLAMLLSESAIKKQGALIKSARLGASLDFGNQSKLEPPKPKTDWKKYILWLVLVLGVMVLAFMAFRLVKQMEQSDTNV